MIFKKKKINIIIHNYKNKICAYIIGETPYTLCTLRLDEK